MKRTMQSMRMALVALLLVAPAAMAMEGDDGSQSKFEGKEILGNNGAVVGTKCDNNCPAKTASNPSPYCCTIIYME